MAVSSHTVNLEELTPSVRALARAVDAGDRVRKLEELGFSQNSLAWMAGAHERSVRYWRTTGSITPRFDDRLRDVVEVVVLLDRTLSPRGIVQWFHAHLRYLNGQRPLDLIRDGEFERVREAAEAFVEGAYL